MKKLSNVLIFGLLLISSFVVLACPSSANSSPTPAPKARIIGIGFHPDTVQEISNAILGDEVALLFQLEYSNGKMVDVHPLIDKKVEFFVSEGTDIAEINEATVKFKKAGKFKLEVIYDDKFFNKITNTINSAPDGIYLVSIDFATPPSSTVRVGSTITLPQIKAVYSNGSEQTRDPVYSVNKANLASLNGKQLEGIAVGDVIVTATYTHDEITKTVESNISIIPADAPVLTSITLSTSADTVDEDKTLTLTTTATYDDGSTKPVNPTYSLDKPSLGSFTNGVFIPASVTKNEQVKITAVYVEESIETTDEKTITIINNISKTLVKIEVNNPPSSVNVGSTLSLPSAIATYSDSTTETITPNYTSSNSNIASISGKVLTGVSAGTVSVTASYEHEDITKTTSFDVTVKDPNSGGYGDVGFNFGDPNSGGNNGDSGDGGIEFDFNN